VNVRSSVESSDRQGADPDAHRPRCRARFSGIGKPIEGTWKLDGNVLTLTGENGQARLKFEVKDDAKKLVPILENGQEQKLGGAQFWFKKE